MLGQNLVTYAKTNIPELLDLKIQIGGQQIAISGYEAVNAIIIQNNIIDQKNMNIAVFHPRDDLLDVFMLTIMGLAAYKDSIIRHSKLRMSDFQIGELVEHAGKVVSFQGIVTDPVTNVERIRMQFGDEYFRGEKQLNPPSKEIPIEYFSEVSKYHGKKIVPDQMGGTVAKKNIKDAVQNLLGLHGQQIGLSGYPGFLIASERSYFVDLLKDVVINNIPFFDIFPSVKCTSEHRQRLGRDNAQRGFMFYFVSSLSTADDVLRDESSIKTLFADARGKSFNNGSLLSSIRNQYDLEDIFWLQTYNQLDSIDKLIKGLGFNIWIWDEEDLSRVIGKDPIIPEEVATNELNTHAQLARLHNSTILKFSTLSNEIIEIPYPNGITLEHHNNLQQQFRDLFNQIEDYRNSQLAKFAIHAAGIANRLFLSSLEPALTDKAFISEGKSSFLDDLANLKNDHLIFSSGAYPEDFKDKSRVIIKSLESYISSFSGNKEKLDQVVLIIQNNPTKRICILTKFPGISSLLKDEVFKELDRKGIRNTLLTFTENLVQPNDFFDIVVWTFKPPAKNSLMLEPSGIKNILLLYPLQKHHLETTFDVSRHYFKVYADSKYRSELLKTPTNIVDGSDSEVTENPKPIQEVPFDLDKVLSSTLVKLIPGYQEGSRSRLVEATLVYFNEGLNAFFQKGSKIKVLNLENESIEIKTVGQLAEGDDVAFLANSKRTVFEELVEFYEHKPEITELVKISELWRTALLQFQKENYLHPIKVKRSLDEAGLHRHIATIENWLDGTTICPIEDNYAPVDVIAKVTNNANLIDNLEAVKDAARKMHALRIKIGRYMAKRITQSYISPNSIIDDPVLRDKLDEMTSHVRIARVFSISNDTTQVPQDFVNKLLAVEDL